MIGEVYAIEKFSQTYGPFTADEAEMLVWYLFLLRLKASRPKQPKWIRSRESGQPMSNSRGGGSA